MNTAEKIALGAGGASVVVLITLWLTLGGRSSSKPPVYTPDYGNGDGYDGDSNFYNGGKRRRRKTRRRK
jgi:hypothetical protein